MDTIEALVDGVQDLIPLPKSYLRVQELVNDPESSLDDITKVIVNDAALTSRILRIANSAYMGLISKVETVGRGNARARCSNCLRTLARAKHFRTLSSHKYPAK